MIWTLSKLTSLLTENGVDLSKWGKGEAKTIHHLLKELIKEECEIVITEGKVIRIVHALSISVIYNGEILKEKYQIFKDGRKRRRRMDCSVAEKLHHSELSDLNSAVKRGLSEELQIDDISTDQISEFPKIHRKRASGSYPDTHMDMILYKFNVVLKESQYKEEGYVENQEDKDTYFVWVRQENLKRNGWVNENIDGSHGLKTCIKIGNELKDISYILTDINLEISAKSFYQYDIGFYIAIEIYRQNVQLRFSDRLSDEEYEEYEEFLSRVIEISNENGYHLSFGTANSFNGKIISDMLLIICVDKNINTLKILNSTDYSTNYRII